MVIIFKTWGQKMYISITLHIVNQFHTKSVVFSNSHDGRKFAIASGPAQKVLFTV